MNKIDLNHMTSLRIPKDWDDWIKDFAGQWDTTSAYIYRSAIKEFIHNRSEQPR